MKYKAAQENVINSKGVIVLMLIGAVLIFTGIIKGSQIFLIIGGLTYLPMLIRKSAYIDEKGLVIVTNYRLFKRYKTWTFDDIDEIKCSEVSFGGECLLNFKKIKEESEHIFENEDAHIILELAKEKNYAITIK